MSADPFRWGEPDPAFGSRVAVVNPSYSVIDFGSHPDRYAVVRDYGLDSEETVLVAETAEACSRFLDCCKYCGDSEVSLWNGVCAECGTEE